MKVHILGAGTPTPSATRFGSSYVAELSGGEFVMVDCGPAATHKMVKAGLWPTKIDHLFFTHHHFDHDVDLPCFLLCRWDQSIGEENDLRVFGPPPTQKMVSGLIAKDDGVFWHDINARINHPASKNHWANRGGTLPRPAPNVLSTDVEPGFTYEADRWRMTSALADHAQPYLDCLAWRLDSDEGSVVFTGDTAPCDPVRELAKDADMMLCMCWDDQDRMDENGESLAQCGTTDAGRMAQAAGVKKLVLVHLGPHLSQPAALAKGDADIRAVYDGEIVFSDELMTVSL